MRATLSVGGKFQAFALARQLFNKGFLWRLITSYPKFEVRKSGIPKNLVVSIIIKEVLERVWNKLPIFVRNFYNPQFFISELFDFLASKKIKTGDIFVGWSSFSLHSLRVAKSKGMVGVIERGSSHIEYQRDILKEEYEKFGVKPVLPHPKIVEKELREYEEADYIAIPSSFVRRTFLERGISENKLIQVPYGVDLSLFKQVPKRDTTFRVIFGGGLSLRKGTHYLLRAFSELNLPNSELLLVGHVNPEIVKFLHKHEGHFKQMAYRPLSELHDLYSQGSVFCLPSLEEGMAMVQAQAMACGLPLICTPNTGGDDLIRDGQEGFVVPIRDTEKLKEKLLWFYKNPEQMVVMGQAAKERVSKGFTWDDYGKKMIAEYERIVSIHNQQHV